MSRLSRSVSVLLVAALAPLLSAAPAAADGPAPAMSMVATPATVVAGKSVTVRVEFWNSANKAGGATPVGTFSLFRGNTCTGDTSLGGGFVNSPTGVGPAVVDVTFNIGHVVGNPVLCAKFTSVNTANYGHANLIKQPVFVVGRTSTMLTSTETSALVSSTTNIKVSVTPLDAQAIPTGGVQVFARPVTDPVTPWPTAPAGIGTLGANGTVLVSTSTAGLTLGKDAEFQAKYLGSTASAASVSSTGMNLKLHMVSATSGLVSALVNGENAGPGATVYDDDVVVLSARFFDASGISTPAGHVDVRSGAFAEKVTALTVDTATKSASLKKTFTAGTPDATVTFAYSGDINLTPLDKSITFNRLPGNRPSNAPDPRSGYWMLAADGFVSSFGDAGGYGNAAVGSAIAQDIEPTVSGYGYWIVDANGRVTAHGYNRMENNNAIGIPTEHFGDLVNMLLDDEVVTSMSATPSGKGYWLFTNLGAAVPFGDAEDFGDMLGTDLNGEVLDSIATPSGKGYFMVAADGGVFAFGDAQFAGSMGDKHLNARVESLVPNATGGYWLVASDGGIFAFGGAPFLGSMGDKHLNEPVSGMVPAGSLGYLMVAEDGGIFAFGPTAVFHGSLGDNPSPSPITAVAVLAK